MQPAGGQSHRAYVGARTIWSQIVRRCAVGLVGGTLLVSCGAADSNPEVAPPTTVEAIEFAAGSTVPVTSPSTAPAEPSTSAAPSSVAPATSLVVTGRLPVFEGGLSAGWADYGWSQRTVGPGAATIDLGNFGGLILAWPSGADDLAGRGPFVAMELAFSAAADVTSEPLAVQLADAAGSDYPSIGAGFAAPGADGLRRAVIPFNQLDPLSKGFDRIVFRSTRMLPVGTVITLDHVGFLIP